jgi:fatty-acyl-CoA synthase
MKSKTDQFKACTIGGLFSSLAELIPGSPALLTRTGERETYAQLNRTATAVAKALLALKISPGSHIAIWALNSHRWIHTMAGASRIGSPFIGLNTGYLAADLERVLNHSDAEILFLGEGAGKEELFFDIFAGIAPEITTCEPGSFRSEKFPLLRFVISTGRSPYQGVLSWDEFIAGGETIPDEVMKQREDTVQHDDCAMIMYTSGTTGIPKGVMHSHTDLVLGGYLVAERLSLTDSDIACSPLPLFHIFGITMPFCSFTTGGSIVMTERFSGAECLQAIEACHATSIYGVVTMFTALLEEVNHARYQIGSLRCGLISGSRSPPDLVDDIIEHLDIPGFVIGYGSTELLCVTISRAGDSLMHRRETLGFLMDYAEMQIRDPNTGDMLPPGEIGEAWVRCPWMLKGYYKMPEITATVMDKDGFFKTGDLISLDDDGYYRFIGRIDELIIRGGENVYAIEIEEPLRQHPAVRDARVVGIPCRFYGEDIVAFVIRKPGAVEGHLEMKKYLRGIIASHKVPSAIIIIDQFPVTGNGKVRLSQLREMAVQIRDGRQAT